MVCSQSPSKLTMMTDNILGDTPAPSCYCSRLTTTQFLDDKDEESPDRPLICIFQHWWRTERLALSLPCVDCDIDDAF